MKALFICCAALLPLFSAAADQLTPSGSLLGMGNNTDGQLAGNYSYNTNIPTEIVSSNVTAVSVGYFHSLWLKNDGSMWGVGEELAGQLGNGTNGGGTGYTIVPVEIQTNGVTAISGGYDFSLFLKSDGTMWGMGDQGSGQLGDGTYGSSVNNYATNVPVKITNGVAAISAGFEHSLFIRNDGSLWAMGDNTYGELGNGTKNPTDVPIEIMSSNVQSIAAGTYFSLFVKNDGSLWGMGYNGSGQLGKGAAVSGQTVPIEIETNGVTASAAGGYYTLFLKSDGTLWGMGQNNYGQLGIGTSSNTNVPVEITSGVAAIVAGDYDTLIIRNDGSLWANGNDQSGQLGDRMFGGSLGYTNLPEEIVPGPVIAIAAGYDHSLFVMGVKGPPPGYNQITVQTTTYSALQFSYVGLAGTNYVLDRTFSLSPPINWLPQETNSAGAGGNVVFFNMPDPATNNFWRVVSLP